MRIDVRLLLSRLLAGRRFGLRGRYAFFSALLATFLVLVLNGMAYFGARKVLETHLDHELASRVKAFAEPIEQAFDVLGREVGSLARQSLLSTALVDSHGRESYLRPFLAQHQMPVAIDYDLVLTDHRGRALAARHGSHGYRSAAWFKPLLEQTRVRSQIERRGETSVLFVAAPIVYALTGTNEGALILETDLTSWLSGDRAPFPKTHPVARVEFFSGERLIARWTASDPRTTRALTRRLDLPSLGLAEPMHLRLVVDEEQLLQPLNELLLRHVLWGVLMVGFVVALSVMAARLQTRRIEALAGEARRIVATGRSSGELVADDPWRDEISDLAAGLTRLLSDLKESQDNLEAQVAQRTADLRAREGDLKRAQAIAHVGSWVLTVDPLPAWSASEETRRIFGIADDGLLSREAFTSRVHPDDRALVDIEWQTALDGGPYDLEYRIINGGNVLWVREQAQLTVDAAGGLVGGIGTVQDITARREVEELLRELSTAVEQSPATIMITDAEGNIRYVNPQFERVSGYAAGEVLGKNPRLLKSGKTLPFEYASLWATIKAGRVWRGEFENRRKDGSHYYELGSISPIFTAEGEIRGFVSVREDITLRKASERALQETRERYQLVLEGAELGTWDWNIADDELSFNEYFAHMLGYRPDFFGVKVAGWAKVVLPEDLPAFNEVLTRHLAGELESIEAELRMPHRLGGHVWVQTKGRIIERDADGTPLRAAGTHLDINERKRAEEALRESERNLREAQEVGRVGSYVLDINTGTWTSSPMIDVIFGAGADYPHTTQGWLSAIHPAEREEMARFLRQAIARKQRFETEYRIVRVNDGAERWVLAIGQIECAEDGTPQRLVGTVQDVTERRLAEAQMREAMAVFRASSQAIMTTDATGAIVSVNPAFTRITGYEPEAAIGQNPRLLKSGRHDEAFYKALWETLVSSGTWEGEIWNRRKNGEIYPQWLTISAVRDPRGEVSEYIALFSDITQRKRQEELVWRQANFDALTGLANRSLLHDRLERGLVQAKRSGRKVGLLFIDLDGFKWINDTLGHDAGDELLIAVARRLESCVRQQDTVARLGGDEFTIVIHDLTSADALSQIGDKVVGILQQPVVLAGGAQHVTGSVGITVYPDDGEDVQTLLKNADIAMYKAKQAGKNRYQFYARQMQTEVLARAALEAELRTAIDDKTFVLHYQPVVDADSGELVGAEALIRWRHPEKDLLYPEDFLAVAEDSKLIIGIGSWVLREAARQLQAWHLAGHDALRLAVNVSGVQFRDEGLPALLEGLVAEYDIAPGRLVLEITESALMDGGAELEARMRRIQECGVEYALDDFGTGYSSLSYLKRFPVSAVKIDRSFVHDCPDDRNDSHLVEAIVKMAHSLELRVVAEGVEKEEQITFLRDLGCDFLQGYLISRPVAAAEFEKLFDLSLYAGLATGDSREKSRLLSALREDDLDVEEWLRRLLGEHSPALARALEEKHWVSGGLDLKQAIESHLAWRRRLDQYIGGGAQEGQLSAAGAGSVEQCVLGEWIKARRADPDAADPSLARLDRVHHEFHRQAAAIVSDFDAGYQRSAERALAGLKFRTASRDVVVALVACFKDADSTVEG